MTYPRIRHDGQLPVDGNGYLHLRITPAEVHALLAGHSVPGADIDDIRRVLQSMVTP